MGTRHEPVNLSQESDIITTRYGKQFKAQWFITTPERKATVELGPVFSTNGDIPDAPIITVESGGTVSFGTVQKGEVLKVSNFPAYIEQLLAAYEIAKKELETGTY